MKVEVNPVDVDTYTVDSRGRITLGIEYAGREDVTVAIIED